MTQQYITLISFGYFGKHFLEKIAEAIKQELKCPVNIKESRLDLSEFFDPGRRQYNGNKLLKAVDDISIPGSVKTVGLFSVDLFIPILTFVFGEAQLKGIGAVVSIHRLHNRFYGLPEDREVTTDRLLKEAVHELGHTFGLIHCSQPQCVMNSSTYVENIDQKPAELCPLCQKSIKAERGFSLNNGFRFPWWGKKQ